MSPASSRGTPSGKGLEVRALNVRRARRQVLRDISLTLAPGELWALVGPNGSGKTSLLEALLGALPCDGHVTLHGQAILTLPPQERARHLTLLGRELDAPAGLSVRGLVELGRLPYLRPFQPLSSEDQAAVLAALERTQMAALAERPLANLSDGERQRAYLARALAQQPRLLLLDEATGHLDVSHRERTLLGIREYVARGNIALMAVHDLELAVRHAGHVALLQQGTLIAAGPILETLTPARLARVFGLEAQVTADERGNALRIFGNPSHSLTATKEEPCN